MCGIAGILSRTRKQMSSDIIKMTEALSHRGPDDFGYASVCAGKTACIVHGKNIADIEATVMLGHRRLSIIDLSGSRQPLSNEDGTVCTVFNGEIYNYLELAELLSKKGHILRNKGDTEVLVHLWEEFGKDMVKHLVGMFAFCIYDSRQDILFLARDRFGQKPIYYFEKNEKFYFVSELQSFFGLEDFKRDEINDMAIAQYFRYGFIPNPETAYKNIFMLPPGHMLERRGDKYKICQYWKPSVTGNIASVDMDELQCLLDESVRIRLRSDVPFGSFLSGGIDSALITASMSKQMTEAVKTFTIFTGKEYLEDESEAASLTANHLKTDHHGIKVEPDFISVSEKLAGHYGQPYADHSSILTYYVSKETRNYVKVALTGDGGDELFAGYMSYLNVPYYNRLGRIPYSLREFGVGIMKYFRPDLSDAISSLFPLPQKGENIAPLFHKHWRSLIFQDDFKKSIENLHESEIETFSRYYDEAVSSNPIDKWMEVDQRLYLSDDILVKVDIASMAVSLECRSPLLDHRLAEFANKISSSAKLEGGINKSILRRLGSKTLPGEILYKPKKGFSMPFAQWIRKGQLKEWMNSLIFENKSSWNNYLREDSVEKLWNDHQTGKMNHQMRLWMIASLVLWQKAVKIR